MKNNLLTKALLALALLFSTLAQATQLNGVYTIDPGQPASTTNFQNFASAVTYLTATTTRSDGGPANSGTVGVSGPVTFMVASGTYTITSAISIPVVPGTSPTNLVTFEGGNGNVNSRIITANLSGTALVIYNQCKYVGFRNITITNNNASGSGVGFVGSTSTNTGTGCFLANCKLNIANSGSTCYGISFGTSTTGASAGSNMIDSCRIDSNIINGGYYGMYLYGYTTTAGSGFAYNRGHKLRNNQFLNTYYYGTYIYGIQNGMDILYNKVIPLSSAPYPCYWYYNYNHSATNAPYRVIGNFFWCNYSSGGYIYNYYMSSTASNPTQWNNNMIGGYLYYGTYWYESGYGAYNEIYYNTYQSLYAGAYGLYLYSSSGQHNIKNNIFAMYANVSYPLYISNPNPTGNAVNYNVYWNPTGTYLGYRGGAWTTANYNTATALGDSSANYNPAFVNPNSDLHLTDGCGLRGVPVSYITTDIDGNTRSLTSPVVGAHEAAGGNNDLMLTKVLAPVIPITLGLQDVVVKVKNVGTNVVNTFDINYAQNTNPVVSQSWSGTLNPCDEVQVVMTGPNQINLVSANSVKVYTSNPNGTLDSRRTNDTISMQFYAPLSGNFTIGGATPDFINFTQATNALASGISGPVTFDVRPGTYNEQVNIPTIAGTSPINTVTFTGQNAASTIITYNTGGQAAVRFNGCKYVTLQGVTVNNTSGSGAGIGIIGNTTNNAGGSNTIKKCIINLANSTGTQYPIMMTSSATGASAASNMVDSLTIDSNTLNNGYYGMYIYGYTTTGVDLFNKNIKVRGNTLNNMYYMGMYLYYLSGGLEVRNNKVNMTTTLGQTNQYGIYAYMYNYLSNQYKGITSIFDGNVVDANYYSMYLYYPYGTYNNPVRITNNIIKPAFARYSSGGYYGIYLYTYSSVLVSDPTPTVLVYNNSVYFNGNGSGYGMYYSGDGGTYQDKLDIKNNIFACSNTAGAALYIGSNPNAGSLTPLDYNVYYRQGGGNVLYRNGLYYTQDNVVSFAGGGSNSYYLNPPPFANLATGDLHITNACTKGINVSAWVPYDVDGETRSTTPNIGADEYPGLDRDVSVDAIVSPTFPVGIGPQNLTVRIRNNGTSTINSVNVTYQMNSSAPVTMPWVGTLNPCDVATVTFDGANQLDVPNSNNTIVIYTSNPNGGVDMMPSNDTLRSSALAPPLRGVYTIGATGADFTTVGAAVTAVNQRGIGGHVTFNINNGTYIESQGVSLANIIGLSDTSRLTFQSTSGVNTSVTIQSNASNVISIAASSFINFYNLTMNQTTAGGNVMNLTGLVTDLNVYNCRLVGPLTTSTSYLVNTGSGSAILRNSTFIKNFFNGCYYGLYLYGASTYAGRHSDVTIDSNTFTGVGIYNTYMYYTRNFKVRNNVFNVGISGPTTYGYVLGPIYNDSLLDYGNNTINVGSGYYYFYGQGYYANGGFLPETRARVYNNVVNHVTSASSYGYWYYMGYYGNRVDIYNNRVINQGASNYQYAYYMGYYGNDIRVYNNVWPLNSAYFAYTGYCSGTGCKFYNNSISGTTSYTWYYMYAGTNSGGGFELFNNSVTNSGSGNAFYLYGTPNSNDKYDFNNVYTNGATLIGNGSGPTFTNMAALKSAATPYCLNCVSLDAGYTNNNTNLVPNAASANSWALNGRGKPVSWITNDYTGAIRSNGVSTGASDIGAYEFTPSTLPPAATLVPTTPPAAGGYQVVLFGQDTIAKINWAGGSVPSSVTVRHYTGTNPPAVVYANGNYMNTYWDIAVSPAGSYNYSLELYHKGIWTGTNPSVANLIGAMYGSGAWQYIFTSASDVTNNKLVLSNQTNFGAFTGTDATTPFTPAVMVIGDKTNKHNVVSQPLTVYPNPFNSELNIRVDVTVEGNVGLNLYDITGKTMATKSVYMTKGYNSTSLEGVSDLKPGVYFLTIDVNGQSLVQKIVKQ